MSLPLSGYTAADTAAVDPIVYSGRGVKIVVAGSGADPATVTLTRAASSG